MFFDTISGVASTRGASFFGLRVEVVLSRSIDDNEMGGFPSGFEGVVEEVGVTNSSSESSRVRSIQILFETIPSGTTTRVDEPSSDREPLKLGFESQSSRFLFRFEWAPGMLENLLPFRLAVIEVLLLSYGARSRAWITNGWIASRHPARRSREISL